MESPKIQRLSKEIKLFTYLDKFPKLGKNVFLASGSKIVGEVEIGNDSSIWYNTVIRGDVNFVTIGKMTNIQDSSTLHVTNGKFPLIIGDKVTIGHSVVLHGCILKDLCLIGMRAVVLDGAVVEEKSMVAAGSVVIPGFVVPSGKLVAGVPGKVIRDLETEELEEFEKSAERYVKYMQLTVESLRKAGCD
jgi:carbonic anhydrase/acetyltransferase-like protein (isoleucine patch superfamily)